MTLTDIQARGKVLEIIAILQDRTDFVAWWQFAKDTETDEDIIKELMAVIQSEE